VNFALSLVKPEHIKMLQDETTTGQETMLKTCKLYCEKVEKVSLNEFQKRQSTKDYIKFLTKYADKI